MNFALHFLLYFNHVLLCKFNHSDVKEKQLELNYDVIFNYVLLIVI